jgi:uncharacterized protein YggE
MKRLPIVASLALVTCLAIAAPLASAAARTITVSGTGIITTVPNQASFSFGVATSGRTAQQALSANASRMNRLVDVLKKLGLRAADLQTAEISLTPDTNQSGTVVTGYSASDTLTATTGHIAGAGAIVDAAVAAGANLVSGPSLTPSDQLLLTRRALVAAIADARARARTIASAAGVTLGAVQTVSEVSNSTPPVFGAAAARAVPASTPVEAGTVQTEEDVSVTFAIR